MLNDKWQVLDMKYGFPMILPTVLERLYNAALRVVDSIMSRVLCWVWGIGPGPNIHFQGKTFLRSHHRGDIVIGNHVLFNSRFSMNPVGLLNATVMDTRAGGRIQIGDYCGFSSVVMSSMSGITIGSHVLVGGNVRIFDHDFHAVEWKNRRSPENRTAIRTRPIVIEDDVFVGTNAIILKGTHIGARSIVAAGSVVFGLDIPPDSLVKGNPAVIVRSKY